MVRAQHDQIYCIYWNFSNFRLFELVLGGRNDWYNCINCFFSIFPPLAGRSTERFYWIYYLFPTFRLSTSRGEFKMIDFTDYIDFSRSNWLILLNILNFLTFRLFDLVAGGQPRGGRSKRSILLNILYFFDFLTSCWEVKVINFTGILDFFNFSTFRHVAVRSNWLILMNILNFFNFSTVRPIGGKSKWSILLNILIFSTFRLLALLLWGQNDQFYRIYIGFFRLFDFSIF